MHKIKPMKKEEAVYYIESALYLIGAALIRKALVYRRKLRRFARRTRAGIKSSLVRYRAERELDRLIKGKSVERRAFDSFKREYLSFKEGRTSLIELLPYIDELLTCILNYLLPVTGMMFLLMTVNHYSSLEYALRLELDGEYVGHIYHEQELITAKNEIYKRLASVTDEGFLRQPTMTFEEVQPDQHTPQRVLVNNLIMASGRQVEQAAGFYINGRFMGAVQDGDRLLTMLRDIKQPMQNQYPNARVEFVQKITLEQGLYPKESIVSSEQMESLIKINGNDTASGQTAYLLRQQAVERVARQQTIPYQIMETIDKNEDITYQEILQEGKNGVEEIVSEITYLNGIKISEKEISREIISGAIDKKIIKGSLVRTTGGDELPSDYKLKSASARNAEGFIWPVDGGTISCDINGYYGHTGNDIQASKGTAIWAAKAGTVVYSGWSGGYGYNVLIDHGDGYKTRYAHCSALLCSVGQQVEQGQQIALVGRTGNASCNHCHFEVILNSQFLDGRNFVGSR